MKIALARVPDSTTARLALECDGALYDVALLEAERPSSLALPADFHSRLFALGGAGLDEVFDRLRSGLRPSRARIGPGELSLEPPCDVDRALACQLAPQDVPTPHPQFHLLDARGLRGEGALVACAAPGAATAVEGSIAALLGEDLFFAAPDEAARAIFGYSLMLEWTATAPERAWLDRHPWDVAAVQLGPLLVTRDEVGELATLDAYMGLDGQRWRVGPFGGVDHEPGDCLAFVSRHMRLRAGDVVGLGRLRGARALVGRPTEPGGTHEMAALGARAAGGADRDGALRVGCSVELAAGPLGVLRGRLL